MATYLEYMREALKKAEFEECPDGSWFAFIPGFDGLWASGATRELAQANLSDALDGWIDVHLKIGKSWPPEVNGITLRALPKLLEE
jgi:predicted RNase H-like HicB family nuclease